MACWRAGIGRSAAGCCCCPAGGRSALASPWPDPWLLALFAIGAVSDARRRLRDQRPDRSRPRRQGRAHPAAPARERPARRPPGAGLPGAAAAGRPPGPAELQRLHDRPRPRRRCRSIADLSPDEADHLVAAGLSSASPSTGARWSAGARGDRRARSTGAGCSMPRASSGRSATTRSTRTRTRPTTRWSASGRARAGSATRPCRWLWGVLRHHARAARRGRLALAGAGPLFYPAPGRCRRCISPGRSAPSTSTIRHRACGVSAATARRACWCSWRFSPGKVGAPR